MSNVKTVSFKGKPYVMVGERVRQVYEQKRDFEVLDSVFQEIAGRVLCKVTILVDGKRFTGNAEAKLVGAAPKSADETNPLECAETSALGRALAFANFGTVDGIASLDEIVRSMTPDEITSAVNDAPESRQASTDHRITPAQMHSVKNLCKLLGREVAPGLEALSQQSASESIAELSKQWKQVQFKQQQQKAS